MTRATIAPKQHVARVAGFPYLKVCSSILIVFLSPLATFAAQGLPAQERMQSCNPAVAMAAAREVLNDPATLAEPVMMFLPADVLFRNGKKDEALFWFYAAQLRSRYQLVFEKGDRGQLMSIMMMTVGPAINNHGFSDVRKMQGTIERVLAWDKTTPNAQRDKPHTPEQRAQVAKVYSGLRDLQDKLVSEGPLLEEQARQSAEQIQSMYAQNEAKRCAPGQIDPSLVKQETRKEEKQVVELVRNHPDVIRAAGAIENASLYSSTSSRDSNMPGRYTVYVRGQRETFAEVDVTRSTSGTQFKLRCTNPVSPGKRTSKDPCAP